jgi:hypothetical protein
MGLVVVVVVTQKWCYTLQNACVILLQILYIICMALLCIL